MDIETFLSAKSEAVLWEILTSRYAADGWTVREVYDLSAAYVEKAEDCKEVARRVLSRLVEPL